MTPIEPRPVVAVPPLARGPHPVRTMGCRNCGLAYHELTGQQAANSMLFGVCPRCAESNRQEILGRTDVG